MTLEKRVENLENLVFSLINTMNQNAEYTDADINGVRKSVADVVQYKDTKKAYISDSECVFLTDAVGEVSASVVTESGKQIPSEYVVSNGKIVVKFEPLTEVAKVSISIL